MGDSLHILSNMIDGYEAILRRIGACSISLDKCGFNADGVLKVWVNSQLERNDVSGEILVNEKNVVEKILRIVDLISSQRLSNLRQFGEGSWSFMGMRKAIKSYAESMKIIIPNRVTGTRKVHSRTLTMNGMLKTSQPQQECWEESKKESEEVKEFCMSSINNLAFPSPASSEGKKMKCSFYHQFSHSISPRVKKQIESTISTENQSSQDSTFIKRKVLSSKNITSLAIQKSSFNFTFGK